MKKIFSTFAIATALFAGYNVYNTTYENKNLNGITFANVEALTASSEESAVSEILCK